MFTSPERGRPEGRHRNRRLGGPAAAVTAGIAASALAVATYAASAASPAPSRSTSTAFGQDESGLGADALATLALTTGEQHAEARQLRAEQGAAALGLSTDLTGSSVETLREASKAISAEKRRAAEEAAAEQAAAEQAAAEQAAAEEAAAEQAAQEAAEREAEEAASRSTEREPAPEPAAPVYSGDPRSIARSMLSSYGWGDDQWGCLDALWQRESGWNHTAMNPSSGAYGIPQSLPGSKMATAGADWQTNPATQIEWGLGYISGRYGTPCGAWAHSESVGWY